MAKWVLVGLLSLILSAAGLARATEGASGEVLEAALRFDDATRTYRATIAGAPDSPEAARARVRLAYLESHAEGGWAPLARLEAVRKPVTQSDADVDALGWEIDAFPRGLVALEARLFCAEHWLRAGQRGRAIPFFDRVARDAAVGDPLGKHAARQAVELRLVVGDVEGAVALLSALGPKGDPEMAARVRRVARRAKIERGAELVLVGFGALVAAAVAFAARKDHLIAVRGAARAALLPALGFSIVLAGFGGAAARYHEGDVRPFVWYGAVAFPLLVAVRVLGAALGPRLRAGRAALAVASALAAAFLTLSWLDPRYLEGFGL